MNAPAKESEAGARRLAVLLVLVGVVFRLWATEHARFTEEESLFWRTALDILAGRDFPLYGPPLTGSTAHHPGPIFYYLIAAAQTLGSDPRWGGMFVAVLHGGAALMIFGAFRRVGGSAAALWGLGLWMFAPWDVLYADRIWLSCVAPVWGTATLYAAVRSSSDARWQAVLLFFALVAPQLHMSAPLIWAAAGAWLYLRPPPRWSRPALAVGLTLAGLCYLPTLLFELGHDLENTRLILRKSRGKAGAITIVNSPLRVFGNAVLASTSEMAYQFARGYWHPFDERKTYVLASGWWAWLKFHGVVYAPMNLVSLGLGFIGWGHTLRGVLRASRGAWRAREAKGVKARLRALRDLDAQDHLTLALMAGLAAATLLLIVSRKGYYPHYSNLLVPFVLWPVALAVARGTSSSAPRRRLVAAAAAVSVVAMFAATVRYYRSVDTLNGLGTTKQLVQRALDEGVPLRLEFVGFANEAAWKNLASEHFGRPLETREGAQRRWRVNNDRVRSEGPGGVTVEVSGPPPPPGP